MDFQIVDINCMLGYWPDLRLRFHDAAGLCAALDEYHIAAGVAFHSDALRDLERGNSIVRDAAAGSGGRIQACYVLRPELGFGDVPAADALLRQLRAERPAAVKLFPQRDRYPLSPFYAGELLDVLNTLGLPVLFDPDQRPALEGLPELARTYPRIRFVLLRFPLLESRILRPLLLKTENVYFDVSTMIDTGWLDEVVQRYGSHRLLFGSNQPFFVPAGVLGMILYARISDQDRQNILGDNWRALQGGIAWT